MARADLFDFAQAALDVLVDEWPSAESVPRLPERRFVSPGEVAWDCEQLVVQVERVFGHVGDIAAEQIVSPYLLTGVRGAVLAVWLIRCVPDIDVEGTEPVLPDADDLAGAAAEILGDAMTVTELLLQNPIAGCQGIAFESWNPAGPLGGLGGGVTRFRVGLT